MKEGVEVGVPVSDDRTQGEGRDVLERPYTVGGGGGYPPLDPPPPP